MPVPEPPHPDVRIRELGVEQDRTIVGLHEVSRTNYQSLQNQIGTAAQQAQQGDQSLYNQIQALANRVGVLEQQMGQALNVFPRTNPWAVVPSNWGAPAGWTMRTGDGSITTSTGLVLYPASRN